MSGLDRMKKRMTTINYDRVDSLLVKRKYQSFNAALKDSYQAEWITLHKDEDEEARWRCLINPSRLTEQFNKKVLSIDFDAGVREGDVFYWDRTNKYWMVDLQQDTEEAYFRAIITECDHQIQINDNWYWIALRGPEETGLEWGHAHNLFYNKLNYSMRIDIRKNEETLDYFNRFKIIKIKNYYENEDGQLVEYDEHRWQVVATDKYSSNTTMQVYLDEYADNPIEEEMIIPKEEKQDKTAPYIDGPQFIDIYQEDVEYTIKNIDSGEFVVSSNKIKITKSDNNSLVFTVITGKSAELDIFYMVDKEVAAELHVHIQK